MPLENDYKVLYKLKGPSRTQIPDSTKIQNVAPLATAPVPDDTTQPDNNLGNLTSLVGTLTGGTTGTIPGQLPGTDFNMGAVNMPEPSPLNPQTSSKEFDADKFARMAGAFGAAIAPRGSWQSRLGATASGLAAENLRGRAEQEQARLEAPDKELDRQYKRARIDSLKAEKDTRTANQKDFEYFNSLSPEKQTAYDKFFTDSKDGRTADQKNLEWYKSLGVDDRKLWEKMYGEKEKDTLDTFEEKERIKAKYRKKDPDEDLTFEDKEKIKAKYKKTEDKDLSPSEKRQRDKMTMDIEHDIVDGNASQSDIDLFNKYSKANYIWRIKKGEKKSRLGFDLLAKDIPDQPEKIEFKAPEDVRNAYKDKIIDKKKATQLLLDHFEGYEE